jgi:flagellar capping protein FliD
MDNFIGKNGNSFEAYWVIHGCPQGHEANYALNDPPVLTAYANFHKTGDTHIKSPSAPGEKFIKEKLPGLVDGIAYTFVRTGIYGIQSDRPGSNYGAITIIMDDMDENSVKKFEQDLKEWFYTNVLNRFTYEVGGGKLKWTEDARKLFRGNHDKQLKGSIESVIKPYLEIIAQQSHDTNKTGTYTAARQQLEKEIADLEQTKARIEQQLAQKYAELENM